MFKFVAAHFILAPFFLVPPFAPFSSATAQGHGSSSSSLLLSSTINCPALPAAEIIKVNLNDCLNDGYYCYYLWDNGEGGGGDTSNGDQDGGEDHTYPHALPEGEVYLGNTFLWGKNPTCKVKGYDGYGHHGLYITYEQIMDCASAAATRRGRDPATGDLDDIVINGSASGLCTTVSVDNFNKGTHLDCTYHEVLVFEPKYKYSNGNGGGGGGGSLIHSGVKSSSDQAVIGGTGVFKDAHGFISKKPLEFKHGDFYVTAGWYYDLSRVRC